MENRWIRASLFSQAALFAYYQLIEWVDLFPWNDVRRGNGQEWLDVIVAVILGVLILATWRKLRWAMAAGVVLYALWVWLQLVSWWVPYFRGASPQWKRVYGRFFSETINFLRSDGVHLPPDASHVVLQLLILIALITSGVAVFQSFSPPSSIRPDARYTTSLPGQRPDPRLPKESAEWPK